MIQGIIKILPEQVANQIAAGEVVQRPSSVLKELVENSVDAGATRITVSVKQAGKLLLQVSDNGSGMSPADAALSFNRHATSKIFFASDLFRISSMGFRGEALASIGAVAQVNLKTRQKETETGTEIDFEGGKLITKEDVSCTEGTVIAVKNIFFNIPVRRSFLKNDVLEFKYITDEFIRQSLANHQVFFSLMHDGREIYHLPVASLKQRIVHLFGHGYDERLIPVQEDTQILKINGFIGKPEFSRKTRGEQFFYLNGRFIKDSYFHQSLMKAYEEMLPADSIPFYTLFLTIDPEKVDVNVHPAKTEVRFSDERNVAAVLRAAVRKALGQYILVPSIDFEAGESLAGISFSGAPTHFVEPAIKINPAYNPFETGSSAKENKLLNYPPLDDKQLMVEEPPASVHAVRNILQLSADYIATSHASGLRIIDRWAALERVLFERFIRTSGSGKVPVQRLLFPPCITLNLADHALLQEMKPEMEALGFELREFGKTTWLLEGIPCDLAGGNEQAFIEDILEEFKLNKVHDTLSTRGTVARLIARRGSFKNNKSLEQEEVKALLDELFRCSSPSTSPSGRPVFAELGVDEIAKRLTR